MASALFIMLCLMCMSLFSPQQLAAEPVTADNTYPQEITDFMLGNEISFEEQTDNAPPTSCPTYDWQAVANQVSQNDNEITQISGTIDYGIWQPCNDELNGSHYIDVPLTKWVIGGTGDYGYHVNTTTVYEGNASACVTTDASGTGNVYKIYKVTSNFDRNNIWFMGAIRDNDVTNGDSRIQLHIQNATNVIAYVEFFVNDDGISDAPPSGAWSGFDRLKVGDSSNTWYYFSYNVTAELLDTGGAELTQAQIDAITYIRIEMITSGDAGKKYGHYDALQLVGHPDANFPFSTMDYSTQFNQSCDRDLRTKHGWTRTGWSAPVNQYGSHANTTIFYEGNASACLTLNDNAGHVQVALNKFFNVSDAFDPTNMWVSFAIRSGNVSSSTYIAQVHYIFYNDTHDWSVHYYIASGIYTEYADNDFVRVGDSADTWYYTLSNVTEHLIDTDGAEMTLEQLESINCVRIYLSWFKPTEYAAKQYAYFDDMGFIARPDNYLPNSVEAGDPIVIYAPTGLNITNDANDIVNIRCDYTDYSGNVIDYKTQIVYSGSPTGTPKIRNSLNVEDSGWEDWNRTYAQMGNDTWDSYRSVEGYTEHDIQARHLDVRVNESASINLWSLSFGVDIDLGMSVDIDEPNNNQKLEFKTHSISANVTELSPALADVTSVKFRYTYENPDPLEDNEIFTNWQTMTLIEGDVDSGIYDGDFEVNTTIFDDNDHYALQVKGSNSNGISQTDSITFIVDRTAESGLLMGKLNEPEYIQCGNTTDDIMFRINCRFADSQRVYTKTLSENWENILGNDIDLVTSVFTNAGNKSEIVLYESSGHWKIRLTFPHGYEPTEDDTCRIYFYEAEPDITNPKLLYVGGDTVDYSLDIYTARDWDIPIWIGETWMPTTQAGWWSTYNPYELEYVVYSDREFQNELTKNVTIVNTDPYDPYRIALDIKDFESKTNITRLYIHGAIEVVSPTSQFNISAILFGLILPVAGLTTFLLNKELEYKLPPQVMKYLMAGSVGGGVIIAVIFQFIEFPTLTIPQLPSLSLTPVVDFITSSGVIQMGLITIAPVMVSLAFVLIIRIEERIKLQIISIGGITSLLLALAFITGMVQLSLLDVSMRATYNLMAYFGVGLAIVAMIYIARTVKPIGSEG